MYTYIKTSNFTLYTYAVYCMLYLIKLYKMNKTVKSLERVECKGAGSRQEEISLETEAGLCPMDRFME